MTADFHLRATASAEAVRDLLAALRARLRAEEVPEAACGTVEIVLAEALNNIVEHACAGREGVAISLHAELGPGRLCCMLSDRGGPLPGLRLPEGRHPGTGAARADLPEGGFGWFLIHSLTQHVTYVRVDGTNHLRLSFDLSAAEDSAV